MICKTVRAVRQSSRLLQRTGMLLRKSEEMMRGPIYRPESHLEQGANQVQPESATSSIRLGVISNQGSDFLSFPRRAS